MQSALNIVCKKGKQTMDSKVKGEYLINSVKVYEAAVVSIIEQKFQENLLLIIQKLKIVVVKLYKILIVFITEMRKEEFD